MKLLAADSQLHCESCVRWPRMEAATQKITVTLPDGTPLELPDGASGAGAAAAIGPGLAKAALAIRVDGELRDLSAPLPDGAEIAILTDRDPEALELIRHDAAHVMAEAVMELYPGTKVRSEEHTSELQSPYDLVC